MGIYFSETTLSCSTLPSQPHQLSLFFCGRLVLPGTHSPPFLYASVTNGHRGRFHNVAAVTSASRNRSMQVSLPECCVSFQLQSNKVLRGLQLWHQECAKLPDCFCS